jgi:transposase
MGISEIIKNRIIKLTLYTNMSAKGIISVVSEDVPVTIEDYCKVLEEYEKNTGKKITKGNKYKEELKNIDDSLLIELCEKGWSSTIILKHLLDNDYAISLSELQKRLHNIYKENKTRPRARYITKKKTRKCGISDNEIMELFDKGLSFVEMAEYFSKIGKKITHQRLNMIAHEIYESRGEKLPKRNKRIGKKLKKEKAPKIREAEFETIHRLRENGLSYENIAQYFKEKGYKTSASTISNACKRIYKEAGKEEPKLQKRKPSTINDRIFELREQGLSYKEIEKELKESGIEITLASIGARGYNEYKRRKVQVLGRNSRSTSKKLLEHITDNELEDFVKNKYTYSRIRDYYTQKGIEVSITYIEKRVQSLKNRINKEDEQSRVNINTMDEDKLMNALINLKETKGATDEQLRKLASCYGMDYTGNVNKTSPYVVKDEMER